MPPQAPPSRIDELRARLTAEPKSRHFFPLGEELRKMGRHAEAEQVLREGLVNHGNYLSAWVSLGRVLREQQRHGEALEALQRAFALDGNNVVTARLLADTYLSLDEKLEAIKKYKLVKAMLPATDEELENVIERLDRELNPDRHAAPAAIEVAPLGDAEPELGPEPFGAEEEQDFAAASSPDAAAGEAAASLDVVPLGDVETPSAVEPLTLSPDASADQPLDLSSHDSPFDDTVDTPFSFDDEAPVAEAPGGGGDDVFSETAPVPRPQPPLFAQAAPLEPQPVSDSEAARQKIRRLQDWLGKVKGGDAGV